MYRIMAGDELSTAYADAPIVTVDNRGEDSVGIRLEFPSSAVDHVGSYRVTQVAFKYVVYYEWNHFEFHRLPHSSEDVEFALVQLVDSPVIEQVKASGRLKRPGVKHFRISFDDHGVYDIVCTHIEVRTHQVVEDE